MGRYYYYTPSHHREDEIEDVASLLAVDIVVIVMIAVDVKAHDGSSPFLLHARLLFFFGICCCDYMDGFVPFAIHDDDDDYYEGWMDGGIKLSDGWVVVIKLVGRRR